MAKNENEFNIRLLGVLHTMTGVVMLFLTIAPIFYTIFVITLMTGTSYSRVDPPIHIAIYLIFAISMSLFSLALSIMVFESGDRLAARESYQYCKRTAYIECILFPLGTVLGILTLKYLKKESIQKLFDEKINDKTSS